MCRVFVEKELLDISGAATPGEIEENLRDIATANRLLGGTSLILHHLSQLLIGVGTDRPISILDMGTGYADIPVAILKWADEHGIRVRITGVDLNPIVVEIASERVREFPEITIERADILDLPYGDGSFDIVLFSQVLHHLDNAGVIKALCTANRLSSLGIIVSELRRRRLCIFLAGLAARIIPSRLSAHDVGVSFRNGFTVGELTEFGEEAGLQMFHVRKHGPCRLALVENKRTVIRIPVTDHAHESQAWLVMA